MARQPVALKLAQLEIKRWKVEFRILHVADSCNSLAQENKNSDCNATDRSTERPTAHSTMQSIVQISVGQLNRLPSVKSMDCLIRFGQRKCSENETNASKIIHRWKRCIFCWSFCNCATDSLFSHRLNCTRQTKREIEGGGGRFQAKYHATNSTTRTLHARPNALGTHNHVCGPSPPPSGEWWLLLFYYLSIRFDCIENEATRRAALNYRFTLFMDWTLWCIHLHDFPSDAIFALVTLSLRDRRSHHKGKLF